MSDVFGFSTAPASGDFLPIIKYDARSGIMFRVDSVATATGFERTPIDISHGFQAQADFENIETGWIDFSGATPSFHLVKLGNKLPDRPSQSHKNGIRFLVKLAPACADGTPKVREVASVAKAFLNGLALVYQEYQTQKANHPGQLPVIALTGKKLIKTGTGDKTSSNYQPQFTIVGWAPRGDFNHVPRGAGAAANGNGQAQTTPAQTPPATGAQRAAPPPLEQAPKPAFDASDFG